MPLLGQGGSIPRSPLPQQISAGPPRVANATNCPSFRLFLPTTMVGANWQENQILNKKSKREPLKSHRIPYSRWMIFRSAENLVPMSPHVPCMASPSSSTAVWLIAIQSPGMFAILAVAEISQKDFGICKWGRADQKMLCTPLSAEPMPFG